MSAGEGQDGWKPIVVTYARELPFLLAWLCVGALCNFLVAMVVIVARFGPSRELVYLLTAWMGVVAAEIAFHAIWSVLGPWSVAKRTLWSAWSGFILIAAFFTGTLVHESPWVHSGQATTSLLIGALVLPLLVLAVQSPLWAARMWLGWHIAGRTLDAACRPLRLGDLFIGMAVIATALAAARIAASVDPRETTMMWAVLIAYSVGLAFLSVLFTVPTVVATLRLQKPLLAVVVLGILHALICVLPVTVMSIIFGRWPPAEFYGFMALWFLSFSVCLYGPMLIARALGFRLLWGRHVEMTSPFAVASQGLQLPFRASEASGETK